MKNVNILLDLKGRMNLDFSSYINTNDSIITVGLQNKNEVMEDNIFNKRLVSLDEFLYKNSYERLSMKDNCFIYLKKDFLNKKLKEYIKICDLNLINSFYKMYLNDLQSNNVSGENVFNNLDKITEPFIDFMFKDIEREIFKSNKTINHLFILGKIENLINKKFGPDYK